MHKAWIARKYRKALTPEMKKQFELKILAESLFKGKLFQYLTRIRFPIRNNVYLNKDYTNKLS